MRKDGVFEPCYTYYVREFLKVLFLWLCAFYIITKGPTDLRILIFAAFLHAFGN